ncbi:hypothetical protein ACTXG6_30695 [Pseudonocardia sp. Cha107L01]|uniref:hypothetical protein n=1 Tax=Pseudonocardia sp. Cha107L01 TaxID=3457576 RepID=UPI00403EEBB7
MATFNMLEAAVRFGVPRFVNLSSETVPGFFFPERPFGRADHRDRVGRLLRCAGRPRLRGPDVGPAGVPAGQRHHHPGLGGQLHPRALVMAGPGSCRRNPR